MSETCFEPRTATTDPSTCLCECGCSNEGQQCHCPTPADGEATSTQPVRYATGTPAFSANDLGSGGMGGGWGHTRGFASRLSFSEEMGQGLNWQVSQWPYLVQRQDEGICVMGRANAVLWFDKDGDGYVARFGGKETLAYDDVNAEFVLTDLAGNVTTFNGLQFIGGGMFLSHTDAAGNRTRVVSLHDNGGNATEVQRTSTVGGVTTIEAFVYTYSGSGNSARLSQVLLRRKVGAGAWTDIRAANYTYYGGSDTYGDAGDLRTVRTYDNESGWVELGTTLYRYYKMTGSSSSGGGRDQGHLLKFVVNPEAYARLAADPEVSDPLTASNAIVAQYADHYFEYDSQRRVTLESVQGGSRTYTFSYGQSAFGDGYNVWKTRTVETLPGGTQVITYANFAGQVMLSVRKSGDDEWPVFFHYTDDGRVDFKAESSAITGYDEQYADLLHCQAVSSSSSSSSNCTPGDPICSGNYEFLKDHDGLVHVYEYHSQSGQQSAYKIRRGEFGCDNKIWEREFTAHTETTASSSSSSASALANAPRTVYLLTKHIEYPDDIETDPAQERTIETNYAHSFFDGTVRIEQRTTTLPEVSTDQNGSGSAATRVERFDRFGNMTWLKDERGFLTRFQYHVASGALQQRIDDVDTTQVSDEPAGWETPAGGGLHLVTDFEFDDLGRVTQELGPSHQVDINGVATTVRSASWTVYRDSAHEVRTGRGYATGGGPNYTYTLVNPVQITKSDRAGKLLEQITAVRSSTSGRLTAGDTFPQASYVRWTTNAYTDCCKLSGTKVYHTIPSAGAGSSGTNYDETTFGYDTLNRRNRTISPGGTITRTVFDARNMVTAVYVGTDDTGATATDPTGGGAGGNNMVLVTANEYDGGDAGGDGNLIQVTNPVDDDTDNDRVTVYGHDWRNRQVTVDGEIDFFAKTYLDNLGRAFKQERYDTDEEGNLIGRNETMHDDRHRVYRTIRYAVDPSTGDVGNSLTDNTWYDAAGNVIKQLPSGSKTFTKMVYDGIGRVTKRYVGFDVDETDYADAFSVTGDTIFEQGETTFDAASNAIQTTSRQRFHNATSTGELTTPAGAQPKARVSYVAMYPDAIGRTQAVANYGTNGGSALSRPSTIPARSDTVLVDGTFYNSDGEAFKTVDPMSTVTCQVFDDAGRRIKLAENATSCPATSSSSNSSSSSSSSSLPSTDDRDRTTLWTYTADGQVATLTAVNATTGNQVTTYVHGTTLDDSDIARGDLLRAVIYPDSDDVANPLGNGTDGIYDRVEHKYNRQGQVTETKDQNETVHAFDFDKLGRQTQDRVTAVGGGIDDAVLRIGRTYEVRGLLEKVTSYDDPVVGEGDVVNEVQRAYNDFGQLTAEYQEHGGAVNISTTPKVQYGYASGSANHIRRTTMTYPNGRVLNYDYGSAASVADNLSRVGNLIDNDGTTHLADYVYLGLGGFVQVDYIEPGIRMDLVTGAGDDPYDGIDRFGRIVDLLWRKYSGMPEDVERIKHGYDRAGNRLWRECPVAASYGKHFDELYSYDGLYQLRTFQRGDLNGGKTAVTNLNFAQQWGFDSTGNWRNFREDSDGNGAWDLQQPRTHNKANEITAIGATVGDDWVDPVHDKAGNMTTIPQPASPTSSYGGTWDAWNRLVKLMNRESAVGEYTYDGLVRRTKKVVSGVTRHSWYSHRWQVLEERLNSSTYADRQFVWGLSHIDNLVLRDWNADSTAETGDLGGTESGLEVRSYCLHDSNWNVVALADDGGGIVERYLFVPYGVHSLYSASYMTRVATLYDVETLFAGYRWDSNTGLIHARFRNLVPQLGVWLSPDPMQGQVGDHRYMYVSGSPPNGIDPFGLEDTVSATKRAIAECNEMTAPIRECASLVVPMYGQCFEMGNQVAERALINWAQCRVGGYSISECIYTTVGTSAADAVGVTSLFICGKGEDPVSLQEYGVAGRAGHCVLGTVQLACTAFPAAKGCCAIRAVAPPAEGAAVGTVCSGQGGRLVHFTSRRGFVGIKLCKRIFGRRGIYAAPESLIAESEVVRSAHLGISPWSATRYIEIPDAATCLFRRPVPIGIYSAWKYFGGVRYCAPGSVGIVTGDFAASHALCGPGVFMYGVDITVYAGLGATGGCWAYSWLKE